MTRIYLNLLFLIIVILPSAGQKSSIIILGDLHYDRIEDHNMEWLATRPDDIRQIREYTAITEKNWGDFSQIIRNRILATKPAVSALIQLGDLSEGLAGAEEKAFQMAENTVKIIEDSNIPVPWIIVKGNHDVTGPGAASAFERNYIPMFRKQTGNADINSASYTYRHDNIQITCADPWDKEIDMVSFIDKELSYSDAKFKFLAIHEPVIPVTERCWHILRKDSVQREKLLEVIARNKAIVLCAHLHRYSLVKRETMSGPIVQVMVISVVSDKNYLKPSYLITGYGPSLAENVPEWEPATMETRKAILSEEAKYVTFYKQTDLPGYALIIIDERKGTINLEYYAAFGVKPYDKINLTRLMEN